MPGIWKTVRVFISSTFRDMHAERDHLIKVTFPALREKLLPHRVELYDIDLRWGITEDEAKNEKVIGLCLEQVDECPNPATRNPLFLMPALEEPRGYGSFETLQCNKRQSL